VDEKQDCENVDHCRTMNALRHSEIESKAEVDPTSHPLSAMEAAQKEYT